MSTAKEEKEKKKGFKIGIIRKRKIKKPAAADGSTPETITEVIQERFIFTELFSTSFWKEVIFDSSMLFYEYWSAIISLVALYNSFFMVARQTFRYLHFQYALDWIVIDYVSDGFYIVDMLVSARLGYIEGGIFTMDPYKIWLRYKKSSQFKIDLLSIFPTDILYLVFGIGFATLRVNRMLRFYRLQEYFDILETRTSFPNLVRIIHLLVFVMLLIHWNACFYYAISAWLGLGSDAWVYPNDEVDLSLLHAEHVYHSTLHEYVVTLWWSVLTLTTIGDTEHPVQTISFIYVIACCMVGVLIFASIFGNVGAMINNANVVRDEFRQKMDDVKQFLEARKVCPELQNRIINWFNYTWEASGTLDETRALICLPYNLQGEIAMQVHLETLRKVRLFQDCEPGLLNELVLKLQPQVFSPGDFVCRKGDVGREMYIVKSGKLQVVSEDFSKVFKEFGAGESFGDLSMLTIPGNKHGNKRSANILSVGFTDLFSLSKDDLLQALEVYPEAKSILIEKASEILRKDGAIDDELAKQAAMEGQEAKVNATWQMVNKLKLKIDKNRQYQLLVEERLTERLNGVSAMLDDMRNILMAGLNVQIDYTPARTGPN